MATKQKPNARISLMERLRRLLTSPFDLRKARHCTREYQRWETGWKRNAVFKGKALTSSMRRRVGSRSRALELGLIEA